MPSVLVVDDTKFSRGRVVAALKPLGFEIREAGDGVEALELYEAQEPDLVISDLLMPRLDGLGLITELRSRGRQTPVIIVSADIQESSRVACQAQSIFAFINKPFSAEQLRSAVQESLSNFAVPSAL